MTQVLPPPAAPRLTEGGQFHYTPRKAEKAEMAVIGAIIQSGNAFNEVAAIIGPDHFYHPMHGRIFNLVQKLQQAGRTINPLELTGEFDGMLLSQTRNGAYLQECMAEIPTVANGAYFARQVLAAAQLREAAEHAVKTMQITTSTSLNDVAEALELIRSSAEQLGKGGGFRPSWLQWDELAAKVTEEVDRIGDEVAKGLISGVPTGWSDVDRLFQGLQGGQVIVIAGRPGSGKTVAGLNIAQNAAMRANEPVLFFSLEMDALECGMRLLSAGARVPLHTLRGGGGGLTDEDWTRIARHLGDTDGAPLFVDDTPAITTAHADAQMYRLEGMGIKPKIVVFDYLQLIKPVGKYHSREQEVASISRDLKLFAKKWDVAVILLAQLNRGPEQRAEKVPVLSDLRESGSVEQDADIVILLYRPDYYDKESPRAGEADFIVAKHRGGPTDTITVAAQLHLSRFMDMAIV